jgi:S1-C subfamily serine protease
MPTAQYRPVLPAPEDARPAPMMFVRLRVQLPPGTEIGVLSDNCMWFAPAGRNLLSEAIVPPDIIEQFEETMEGIGYDVTGSLNIDFEDELIDELQRSEYGISAKIVKAQVDACYQNNGFLWGHYGAREGYIGELYLDIEWSIRDNLRRKTVYKTTTPGYAKQSIANAEGLNLMMNEAFAMAAHNLGADPAMHALIYNGARPDYKPPANKGDERPRLFDPLEKVELEYRSLSTTPVSEHIDEITDIAVMIEGSVAHGSGFFISKQGHILTNNHVVGDARNVRVLTKGRKEKLVAEVLRVLPGRDVALLKLTEIPENLDIKPLPIRTHWPKVSEEIYAIGAPLATRHQDTVTKGIVSAHRKNLRAFGSTQDYIQGDVAIHGGNSGGPLIDAHGNIVGMSVAGYLDNQYQTNASLNLFIPIEDALKAMDIEVAVNEN